MALSQKVFMAWEHELKTFEKNATTKCVDEIKQTFETVTNLDKRRAVALKVLRSIVRVRNVQAGMELFPLVLQHLNGEKESDFVQNLKYFLSVLIYQHQYKEAIALCQLITCCAINEKTINDIFEIHIKSVGCLIAFGHLPENYFKKFSSDIIQVLHEAQKIKDELFLDFMFELYEHHNFMLLLKRSLPGWEEFLKGLTSMTSKCHTIKSLTDFTVNSIHSFVKLVDIDFKSKTNFALPQLKSYMNILKNNNAGINGKDIVIKLLTLLYFLLKLFSILDVETFRTHCRDVTQKLIGMLKCGGKTDWWVVSGAIATCYILWNYSVEIVPKLCEKSADELIRLMIVLAEILPHTHLVKQNLTKAFCSNCDTNIFHVWWSLTEVWAAVYQECIEFGVKTPQFEEAFLVTLTNAMQLESNKMCQKISMCVQRTLCSICGIIRLSVKASIPSPGLETLLDKWSIFKVTSSFLEDAKLIQLYKQVLKLNGNHRKSLEMACLWVVYRLNKPETNPNDVLNDIANCCHSYADAKVDVNLCICEILDGAQLKFKIPPYDRKLLRRLQLEASVKYTGVDEAMKVSLAEKVMSEIDNEIEFSNLLEVLTKANCNGLQEKIDWSISKTKRTMSWKEKDPLRYLLLGRLLLRKYLYMLQTVKSEAKVDIMLDINMRLVEYAEWKKFNVNSENKFLGALDEILQNFEAFESNLKGEDCDWSSVSDDLSLLARHFMLRGYHERAFKSWLLLYKLSSKFDGKIQRIRAVSFFAEHSDIFRVFHDRLDLNAAIREVSNDILANYKVLGTLTPRNQNYMLLALINIGLYNLRQGNVYHATYLVDMARIGHKQINRSDTTELVGMSLLAFNFHMLTRHKGSETKVSPFVYINQITDSIYRIKYVTSEDSINMPIFLYRVIFEMVYFTIHRTCASPLRHILCSLQQFVQSFALGLRLAQLIAVLAHIDFQKERIDDSMMKLMILNALLMKSNSVFFNVKSPREPQKLLFPIAEGVVRDRPLSPNNLKYASIPVDATEPSEYFVRHAKCCDCSLCRNADFKMISFEAGNVLARGYFLQRNYKGSVEIFEEAFEWSQKYLKTPVMECRYLDSIFSMLVCYSNVLRLLKQHSRALTIFEEMVKFLKRFDRQNDQTYKHIIYEGIVSLRDAILSEHYSKSGLITKGSKKMLSKSQKQRKQKKVTDDLNRLSNISKEWSIDKSFEPDSKSELLAMRATVQKSTKIIKTPSSSTSKKRNPELKEKVKSLSERPIENGETNVDASGMKIESGREDVIVLDSGDSENPVPVVNDIISTEANVIYPESKSELSPSEGKENVGRPNVPAVKFESQPRTTNNSKNSKSNTSSVKDTIESFSKKLKSAKKTKTETLEANSNSGDNCRRPITRSKTPRF